MDLKFNVSLSENYKSSSQKARVLTQDWFTREGYCPCCLQQSIVPFENNRAVADFFCSHCKEEYELKSKKRKFTKMVQGSAYSKMMERINADNNPNFLLLSYNRDNCVDDFFVIPKQFITEEKVIKRKPLSSTAQRKGWIGCNIDISNVPEKGKIFIVRNGVVRDSKIVEKEFKDTLFLRENTAYSKGWLLEVLKCIERIPNNDFSLVDIYKFEEHFQKLYPKNRHIKEKIREQLQLLRNKNMIEFIGRGKYKKIV